MSGEELDQIAQAAELHDVGKMAIPDAILKKPGPLDHEEWEFIRGHTIIGERIVSAAPALAPVAELIRSSHERFNGTGYPDSLKGDEIPLGARVVAVCDAYDAMIGSAPVPPRPLQGGCDLGAPPLRERPVRPGRRGRLLPGRGRPRARGRRRRGGHRLAASLIRVRAILAPCLRR